MNALVALLFATLVVGAGGGLLYWGIQGPLGDGCRVHLENRDTRPVSYAVEWPGERVEGILDTGASRDLRVCTVLLGAAPDVVVTSPGRGEARIALDRDCSDPVFALEAEDVRALPRAC